MGMLGDLLCLRASLCTAALDSRLLFCYRFFAKQSGSEGTPSDRATPKATKAMRKLDLGAMDEGGCGRDDSAEGVMVEADDDGESARRVESHADDNAESERVKGPEALKSFSSLPSGSVIATIPESPAESPPRCRTGDSAGNLRRKRLLEEFSYSKRRKTEATTALATGGLESGALGNKLSLVPRNPFSKASPTKITSSASIELSRSPMLRTTGTVGLEHQTSSCSQADMDSGPLSHDTQQTISQSTENAHTQQTISLSTDSASMEMGSSGESSLGTCTQVMNDEADSYQCASLPAEPQPSRSFMTSDDFLTSAASYTDGDSMSSASGSVSSTVEMYSDSSSGTTSQMATNSQPVNMDVIDLTHETVERFPSHEAGRTPRPCSRLLSALTARRAASDSARRRKGPKAGLPRRNSSSARFNPPRPVDQSSLKQMVLGQYSFQR